MKEILEQGDGVWELLGRSPARRAPAGFAAEVMREIRRAEPELVGWGGVLRWLVPGLAAACVALSLGMSGVFGRAATAAEREVVFAEALGLDQLIASGSEVAWADLETPGF